MHKYFHALSSNSVFSCFMLSVWSFQEFHNIIIHKYSISHTLTQISGCCGRHVYYWGLLPLRIGNWSLEAKLWRKNAKLLYPFSCKIYCQAIQRVVVKWSHKSTQHNLFRFLFSPLRPFTPTYTWTVLHKIVFTLLHFGLCNP